MKKIIVARSLETFGISGNYVCEVNDIRFFVKIALYPLFPFDQWKMPPSSKTQTVDAEINIMRAIASRIIKAGVSPHFVEILSVAKCSDVSKYINDKDMCSQQLLGRIAADNYPQSLFCSFLDMIESNHAIDKFALIFSELCEMSVNVYLTRYMPIFPARRDILISSIIFQVYYSLAAVNRIWPSFRHGDLLVYNIMIKLGNDGDQLAGGTRYLQYRIDNKIWNIPYFGTYVKIIDFGHSEIPEEGIHSAIQRSADLWVPDHITFVTSFQSLITNINDMTIEMSKLFGKLNPLNLSLNTSPLKLVQLSSSFPTPMEALQRGIFDKFETIVNEELIIHQYTSLSTQRDLSQ